jgi:hypothetical protein
MLKPAHLLSLTERSIAWNDSALLVPAIEYYVKEMKPDARNEDRRDRH